MNFYKLDTKNSILDIFDFMGSKLRKGIHVYFYSKNHDCILSGIIDSVDGKLLDIKFKVFMNNTEVVEIEKVHPKYLVRSN